jgi:asparagine synthase (glutamine-hydrolysing)
LSILDLSVAGHQPMTDPQGRAWIVYNGEVYNFRALRDELLARGHDLSSDGDTEVILHAYLEWGERCVERFNGMWSFAIWDRRARRLFLSRDRFGIKPMYYARGPEGIVFASEIKAILASGAVAPVADDPLVVSFLRRSSSDRWSSTTFRGIRQLRGGESLTIDLSDPTAAETARYWDLSLVDATPLTPDPEHFRALFEDAVRSRLVADVPVGACLSGGLDSSSIVCTTDRMLRRDGLRVTGAEGALNTFSARYEGSRHDEGRFIREVVGATRVRAHDIYPTGDTLPDALEALVYHQEEPFGSLSIFAQWSVFERVRQAGVTVTLDGQGADELLAGYHSSFPVLFASLLHAGRLRRLVRELRGYRQLFGRPGAALWGQALGAAARFSVADTPYERAWAGGFAAADTLVLRRRREPAWLRPGQREAPFLPRPELADSPDLFQRFLYASIVQPGLHHLLHYEDRNSMAFSIESRVPFLDHRLVEYAFALPREAKISEGVTKRILRESMVGVLPDAIRERSDKIGFSTPQSAWLRTTLRSLAGDLLHSKTFRARPYFDAEAARTMWQAHLRGERDHGVELWRILSVEMWLRRFMDGARNETPSNVAPVA